MKDIVIPPEELLEKCRDLYPNVMDRGWVRLACTTNSVDYFCSCKPGMADPIVLKNIKVIIKEQIKTFKVGWCIACGNFRYGTPV